MLKQIFERAFSKKFLLLGITALVIGAIGVAAAYRITPQTSEESSEGQLTESPLNPSTSKSDVVVKQEYSKPASSTTAIPSTAQQGQSQNPANAQGPSAPAPNPAIPQSTPPVSAPAPQTTPPAPQSLTACTNPSYTSSANYGTWNTNGYLVNNNIWNEGEAGPQTIYACAWNNWYIISNQPGSGTDDSVKSYPDTQKHVSIPLGSMTTIPSTFQVSTPAGGGSVKPNTKQWNAAYDLWLDNFDTEVMVWTNWTANWQYWHGVYNGVYVTIDGVSYAAYRNNDSSAMWFIRQNVTNTGSVDLASVLRWAVNAGWLRNSQVLNEIEYGFEVLYTGEPTRFDLLNYTLSTN